MLVAVSATDLLGSDAERAVLGTTIRARLNEIQTELGVRLPLYIVLTKLDLLQGFDPFFDSLSRDERNQVWGVTLPLEVSKKAEAAGAALGQGFAQLVQRLAGQTVMRVHPDTDVRRRSQIFGFPAQVNLLGAPLAELVSALTQGTRFNDAPWLRGLYLTSGTQQGRPLDRVLAGLGSQLGLDPGPATRIGAGRSYFLKDLLAKVVFTEAGLAGQDPRADRRRRLIYAAGVATATVALLAATGVWVRSYLAQSAALNRYADGIGKYRALTSELARADIRPYSPVVVDSVSLLAKLPFQTAAQSPTVPAFGLSQAERVGEPTRAIVQRELNQWLLPAFILRLETDVRAKLADPDTLYQSLRTYLMLGGRGPIDRPGTLAWLQGDLNRAPAGLNGEQQLALQNAQKALLAGRLDPPPLDARLIDQARVQLASVPAAQRAFAQLRYSAAAQDLPVWRSAINLGPLEPDRIAQLFGPTAQQVEVPGLFSKSGYFKVFLPALIDSKSMLKEQLWVMGQDPRSADTMAAVQRARIETAQLYATTFRTVWRDALQKLAVTHASSPAQAEQQMRIAADPSSPVKAMLEAVARETDLRKTGAAGGLGAELAAKVGAKADAVLSTAAQLDPEMAAIDRSRAQIEQDFARLRTFVLAKPGQPSQLDAALQQFGSVADKLAEAGGAAAAPGGGGGGGSGAVAGAKGAVAVTEQKAASWPSPMDAWGQALAQNSGLSVNASSRKQLGRAFSGAGVGDACGSDIDGHFPLSSGGADINLAAFAKYFSPSGGLANFFEANLKPYVVINPGKPWQLTEEGKRVGIGADVVQRFEKGEQVRKAYFAEGSLEPKVFFRLALETGDPTAQKIVFTLGDQTITFDSTATATTRSFVWPDPLRSPGAGVEFFGADNASLGQKVYSGDWGLFRLIKASNVQSIGPNDFRVTVTAQTRKAVFRIKTTQGATPFAVDPLVAFRCPSLQK